MRIAQIAPLDESVPPRHYGGTERVVSYLTEELVAQGHDVTLFASGDSSTSARLCPCCDLAQRSDTAIRDPLPDRLLMLAKVLRRAGEFDVLHFHTELLHLPLLSASNCTTVTTLHGRVDTPELSRFYNEFRDAPLVSISSGQQASMLTAAWIGMVHHGLPKDLLAFHPDGSDGYLAFLGRICPEKRPDRAIEIANRCGIPLKIAAKVDRADRDYWTKTIKPMIDASPLVEFLGEIDDTQKGPFLGGARVLLFPIDWPEPFGLAMIEAMSCGTPVLAWRIGAATEVVEDGVSGFLVDNMTEAVAAVKRIRSLSRPSVRATFERRFTASRMARDYIRIYRQLASGNATSSAAGSDAVQTAHDLTQSFGLSAESPTTS